jgi:hypothetical protein
MMFRSAMTAALALAAAAHAQSPLTTALPNNGSGGVFIDLTPRGPAVEITQFDVAYTGTTGSAVQVEIWTRPGSYVGFDGSPAGWTLHETVDGIRQGSTVWTPLELRQPILIDRLTGVYLHCITSGGGIRYTGTGANPPQTNWSNADLELFGDIARTGNVPFGGSLFTPRTFSGNIHYRAGTAVCYPDCDGNEVLDFFDFLCFQNSFLAGDPYADCDGNGVLDFFDFLCFQNEFLAGCP